MNVAQSMDLKLSADGWLRGVFRTRWRDHVRVELLARPGCHLCEDALDCLGHEFGIENVAVIDVTQHPSLEDEFVFRIPVVRYNQTVIAEGIITRADARAMRSIVRSIRSIESSAGRAG